MRTRHRVAPIIAVLLASLFFNTATANAYTRFWDYRGEFRASLTTGTFNNTAVGEIKITVSPSNCTSGYGSINFQLQKQSSFSVYQNYGTSKKVTCQTTGSYTFAAAPTGTYRMYFSRSGPTGQDENWKLVTGRVSHW